MRCRLLLTGNAEQDFETYGCFFAQGEDFPTMCEKGIIRFKQGVGLDAESHVLYYL